jgi:membrane fusion protein (multidrug efflux system)
MRNRLPLIAGVVVILFIIGGVWLWATSGRESTDDAQVDAHVTPVAARIGGTVLSVPVADNQQVEGGAVLVEIDPRDYQVALDKARADLADAEAAAVAARADVPITSATATGSVSNARGGIVAAEAGIEAGQRGVTAAQSRLASAQAKEREAEANATKTAKDVERLRSLLGKDEISQQQFDAAVAAADAAKATLDGAKSQVEEAQIGIRVAESNLNAARGGHEQAMAQLRTAETAPDQIKAIRARADAADAHVKQLQAAVQQAELNLQYATVKSPVKGVVSKKTVEVGQVIQPGQPLMTIIPLDQVWITANFKETQLDQMRPGQPVRIQVDAYGGKEFKGHVESIAAATGARFSLLPPENATGNFVKVVQRVPVKIVLEQGQDPQHLLRPGMSVTPTVYISK